MDKKFDLDMELLEYEDIKDKLTPELKKKLLQLIEERDSLILKEKLRKARNSLENYTPIPKQLEFHNAGSRFKERMFMAANQVGKTLAGANEMAIHLTGRYPTWWKGLRFSGPIVAICGSPTYDTNTKGIQKELVGESTDKETLGTKAIPYDCIVDYNTIPNSNGAISSMLVRHVSGGNSVLKFGSYVQGRETWQSYTADLVWFDEEPPEEIYFEGLTRTNKRDGSIMLTFTPLMGRSSVVNRFYEEPAPALINRCTTVQMGIMDATHYSLERRKEILSVYPAHEVQMRALGLPVFGSGLVFPIDFNDVVMDPIKIPKHWAVLGGIDFGWDHPTGVVKIAWDKDNDVIYVTTNFRDREKTPIFIKKAIKTWGNIEFAFPHDGLQHDKGSGEQLAEQYKEADIRMLPERATFENGSMSVEAGLLEMTERFQTGRLKIFNNCQELIKELSQYHRKDGKLVKKMDDTICALRYAIMMKRYARPEKALVKTYKKTYSINHDSARARV